MNASIEDIKNMLLADSGINLVFGVSLFLYSEPASPNNVVTLFETPGMPPVLHLGSNKDSKHYERPSIQVRIRNVNAVDGYALAYKIQNILLSNSQEEWGDYLYSSILPMNTPNELDWDSNKNIRIISNYNIQRRLK